LLQIVREDEGGATGQADAWPAAPVTGVFYVVDTLALVS
jgi:hypothetical protein